LNDLAAYLRHRDEIAGLLDPRMYTIAWLDREITLGRAMVMGSDSAVIVFELKHYPTGATDIHGLVAAGELAAIKGLIEQAENFGRDQGCIGAQISSREGWAKVLKAEGYAVHQVTIRKEL
jgi:hypothetical protein